MPRKVPYAIDCFCGAGGLSLGLRAAGFHMHAAFDNDHDAVATYSRNLGPHVLKMNAEQLRGRELSNLLIRERCSLVAGGPPCQGFSVQRRGHDRDNRNDLVLEFLRIVIDISPIMFLMENVSAIQGKRGRGYLDELVRRAEKAGYRVYTKVLDAADYGVAQHRRRMFVVGELDDGIEYFTFPTPTFGLGTYLSVRSAIGDLPSPSTLATTIPNHEPDNISDLNRKRIAHVPPGGGRADIPPELRLPCHRVSVEKAGHRNVYGRLHWNEPAGTITTKCNSFTRGRFAHPSENRNITMREAARLQGFPDTFIFEGDKVAVAHQIGNAVPPPFAEQLGRALLAALDARKHRNGRAPSRPHQLALTL